MTNSLPFADINAAACQCLPELVRRWLPNGRPEGNEWFVGNLAGEPGRSLRIVLFGPKCGVWKDFATNESGGDPISLAAAVMGVGQAEAAQKLGCMLGVIEDRKPHIPDDRVQSPSVGENGSMAGSDQEADDTEASRLCKARTLASECVPVDGTPASTYLVERSINPGILPLGEVRWHPPSSAIMYVSRNSVGELMAVQRVSLDWNGKAKHGPNGKKNKRTNGILKGSALTLLGDSPNILVCDGPEDALSLWQVTGAPVRCAFGMNLGEVPLPEGASVILVADNDDQDSAAAKAVAKAADRLMKRGFSVKVTYPPAGIKDSNDLLRLHGPEAVKKMVAAAARLSVVEHYEEGIKEEIVRLAKLSSLDYERERSAAAKRLGVRATVLDRLVKVVRSRKSAADEDDLFPVVEPWPEPVDLAKLLDDICRILLRFIICDVVVLRAVALWVAFTWLIDRVQVAPLLVITAPEKRCGKSVLLSLVKRLSYRPLAAANISMAAVFRAIEAYAPTLVIDEADTFLGRNEELRGILNSGHTRETAFVIRLEGDDHELRLFSTWGAKAVAGIGHLAETIMDRSIVGELRRKRGGEAVEKLRHADPGDFDRLTRMLARFAEDAGEIIGQARPVLPAELNDRAQDNWEPLLAIADYAGGHWPETARATALELSGSSHEVPSVSTELLADIRDIFEQRGCDRIATADLLVALIAVEEQPWATYSKGRPITPRALAKLLGEYGIKPHNIWVEHRMSPKGYHRDQFEDAFARYLPVKLPESMVIPPPPVPSSPHVQYQPPPPISPRPVLPPPSSPHGLYQLPPPMPPRPVPPPPPALPPWALFPAHSVSQKPLAAAIPPSATPKTAETLPSSDTADKSGDVGDDIDL
jgi:putative DNA primase/helicase